jgi:hypothetical protein
MTEKNDPSKKLGSLSYRSATTKSNGVLDVDTSVSPGSDWVHPAPKSRSKRGNRIVISELAQLSANGVPGAEVPLYGPRG